MRIVMIGKDSAQLCQINLIQYGVAAFREAPPKLSPGSNGHCPNGAGVSTLARMVWGPYLEKFKWAICLIMGGPGWFGALITINAVF